MLISADPLALSDVESPAFHGLQARIAKRQDIPDTLRDIVFCVSYALYKRRKLVVGKSLKDHSGQKDAPSVCGKINAILNTEESYDGFIGEAKEHLSSIVNESSMQMLKDMSGVYHSQLELLLSPLLERRSKSKTEIVTEFVFDTFFHALHIIAAAVMIFVAAKAITVLGPPIAEFIGNLAKEHLGPFFEH